ncbi:unnamed protein product, partial [marine sediment metagenome]
YRECLVLVDEITVLTSGLVILQKLLGQLILIHYSTVASAFQSDAPPIVKSADFKSAKNGDWNDPNTWDPIGIPASGDPVQILGNLTGGPHIITVKGDQTCGNLTIDEDGRLYLDTTVGCELKLDDGATLDNDGEIKYIATGVPDQNDATLTSAGM